MMWCRSISVNTARPGSKKQINWESCMPEEGTEIVARTSTRRAIISIVKIPSAVPPILIPCATAASRPQPRHGLDPLPEEQPPKSSLHAWQRQIKPKHECMPLRMWPLPNTKWPCKVKGKATKRRLSVVICWFFDFGEDSFSGGCCALALCCNFSWLSCGYYTGPVIRQWIEVDNGLRPFIHSYGVSDSTKI